MKISFFFSNHLEKAPNSGFWLFQIFATFLIICYTDETKDEEYDECEEGKSRPVLIQLGPFLVENVAV